MDHIKKISWLFIGILFVNLVLAFPILPCQFYGEVIFDQKYAPSGTNISTFDGEGNLCGTYTLEGPRDYRVSCRADNPDTPEDEGATEGDIITFRVNNAETQAKALWHEGSFIELDIIRGNPAPRPIENLSQEQASLEDPIIIVLFILLMVFIIYNLRKT
jgi:hypothetical protein